MHLTPKLHGLLLKCFCKGVNERVERYLMFVFNSTGSNPFFSPAVVVKGSNDNEFNLKV